MCSLLGRLEDLKAVLKIEVDGKNVHGHINDMLSNTNISQDIKYELTEIL
jgi:hypothetical protein